MKKFLSLCILCAAAFCLSACSALQSGERETIGFDLDSESDEETAEQIDSEDMEGFSVDFENAYYTTSGGKNYVLVEAMFSNDSELTKSFDDVYSVQAFQNGVGITQTNNWTCSKYDMTAYAAPLKPNYSTKVYIGFEARTESDDVSIECVPLGGGNTITQTMGLTKIVVETTTAATTQTTTQAVAQAPVYAPAPPPANYSSSGKYTCQGRSMSAAAALMTQSEKAIISNSSDQTLINEQYAKHGYCFSSSYWHTYFYGYDH